MRRNMIALVAALMLALTPVVTGAQPTCALAPVFEPFRDAVGAEIVGECSGNPSETSTGDLTQTTTRGVLVHRIADGVTAFTDDTTTWLDGPEGLQSRANADRLAWEPPVETPVASQPAPPVTSNMPPASATKLTPALKTRCSDIVASTPNRGGPTLAQQIGLCEQLGEQYGAPGVDCYARATQRTASLIGKISTQTHSDLFNAELTVCTASIR
jgi:hypothetical protein